MDSTAAMDALHTRASPPLILDAPATVPVPRRARTGYAGPLGTPDPVRSEAGIAIPAYAGNRRCYTRAAWQHLVDGFGATGAPIVSMWTGLRALLDDARVDLSHLMRTEDLSVTALLWHVRALGRTMQRRLQIEASVSDPTQDGLRLAIQDTWLPSVTRLRRVVGAIAALPGPRADLDVLWEQVRDVPVGRALAYGLEQHGQRLPVRPEDLANSLSIINHREVLWSVAAAAAGGGDVWNERSLFRIIQDGMTAGGGQIYRSRRGILLGGLPLPHPGGYAENEPSHVLYRAADACWADARGLSSKVWQRERLPPDLATAVQCAIGALAPALAVPDPAPPDPATERAGWELVISSRNWAAQMHPDTLRWMCLAGYVVCTGGQVWTTDAGRERWRAHRAEHP